MESRTKTLAPFKRSEVPGNYRHNQTQGGIKRKAVPRHPGKGADHMISDVLSDAVIEIDEYLDSGYYAGNNPRGAQRHGWSSRRPG